MKKINFLLVFFAFLAINHAFAQDDKKSETKKTIEISPNRSARQPTALAEGATVGPIRSAKPSDIGVEVGNEANAYWPFSFQPDQARLLAATVV